MHPQVGSVGVALVLSSGLLLALLYGPGQPAASHGRLPRAAREVGSEPAASAAPAADEGTATAAGPSGRLLVLDVSTPTRATVVGQSGTLSSVVRGLALDAPYVYLLDPAQGVQVLDGSDPTHPTDVGTWRPDLTVRALVATRGQVYVADYAIDAYEYYADRVAVREQVSRVSGGEVPASHASALGSRKGVSMAASGDYVYVASQASGLRVVDVSDASRPVEVGRYAAPDNVLGVAVAGHHAYVATYTKGLRVVDVADPTRPAEVGAYLTPGIAMDVAVDGRYAYVADHATGLHVVDVSDPTAPRGVKALRPPYYTNSVVVADGYAYVTDGACGLRVVDVRAPTRALEVAHYPRLGVATAVAVAGRYAYLAVTRLDAPRACAAPPPAADQGGILALSRALEAGE
jgi:hypothetical protein